MKLIPLAAVLMLAAPPPHRIVRRRRLQHPPLAQETPEVAEPSVIRVGDNPDQIIRLRTRVRHTTVIQLPGRENILDFVVGDSEYWHLDRSGQSRFLETHQRGRQHQRRPGLRIRDVSIPSLSPSSPANRI